MDLPLAETLKLILNGGPPGSGASPGAHPRAQPHDRLAALFAALQDPAATQPAHEIEDEIWAIWTSHTNPALEARLQRAISGIARRRFGEAGQVLDDLVREAPRWAEAWNKRATLHFLIQRDAESIADIRCTLQLEPRHFGAICGFGQICLRHGETAAAASAFGAALRLNPHLDSLRATLAELEPRPPTRLN
jgi:Tfp pilus assembly protein PilF